MPDCIITVTFVNMNIIKEISNTYKALMGKDEAMKQATAVPVPPSLTFSGVNAFLFNMDGKEAYSNKIFYTAQNILVKKLIEAPIMFSKKGDSKAQRKVKKFYGAGLTNEARAFMKVQSIKEVENHDLNKLFDSPNDYQSGIELMEDFWYNYAFGDGYLYFETLGELSRNQRPVAVHSLSRGRVMAVKSFDKFSPISFYRYTTLNGDQIEIPKEQILHLKHWNPEYGSLQGMGVDVAAAMDICLNKANNETQGSAFRNGGRGTLFSSDIHVSTDGENVTEKLTSAQVIDIRKTIANDYAGISNYKKLHFTNGKVEVQSYGDTNAEMELVAAEDSHWKNIFAASGVPWALSPVATQSSENTVIQAYKSLVTNTVLPEVRKFDQKLNQKIAQWWPDMIAVTDVTEYSELAPDLKLMKEIFGSPLIKVDEHRAVFSYDALGGKVGNTILVPSGFMDIEDLLAQSSEMNSNDNVTDDML